MDNLEPRVRSIEERNLRVEQDKAWEISMTRRISITLLTWGTASVFLWLIEVRSPLTSALVPAGGYYLSTLSLPWIRQIWIATPSSRALGK